MDDTKKFYNMVSTMDKNGGCILFQTPPSFKCDEGNFRTMLQFMDNIDNNHNNVIEFRHSSWWNEDVKKLLKAHYVALCTVSGLNMPVDVMVTADFSYKKLIRKLFYTIFVKEPTKDC